jgi:Protein of unknown function (DUF2911)
MQKIIITAFICCLAGITAGAQVKMPAPSTTQTIKQDFALGTIELVYSRPNAKGRKVYGDLVPFGKLWRTGANAATRIKFSEPAEVGGKKIDSGTYVIYTIPANENWEVIFNKGLGNWGVDGYKESQDVCRFTVPSMKMKTKLETFTMQFAEVKPESCELHIMWEKTAVAIPITVNIKDKVRAQIEAAMLTDKKPYWQAAQFYNEYDVNKAKALDNCTKALQGSPKAYWIWLYKARIQKDMGDYAGAKESATKSLELAKEDKNDDYVKMNEELLKKLK